MTVEEQPDDWVVGSVERSSADEVVDLTVRFFRWYGARDVKCTEVYPTGTHEKQGRVHGKRRKRWVAPCDSPG